MVSSLENEITGMVKAGEYVSTRIPRKGGKEILTAAGIIYAGFSIFGVQMNSMPLDEGTRFCVNSILSLAAGEICFATYVGMEMIDIGKETAPPYSRTVDYLPTM